MKYRLSAISFLFLALLITGCGGGGGTSAVSPVIDLNTHYSIVRLPIQSSNAMLTRINDQGVTIGVCSEYPAARWDQNGQVTGVTGQAWSYPHISAINNSGLMVGYMSGEWSSTPRKWDATWQSTTLRVLAGYEGGTASSVNNYGQSVGCIGGGIGADNNNPAPVLWNANGECVVLSMPNNCLWGEAIDINDSGQIIGTGNDSGSVYFILWQPDGSYKVLFRQQKSADGNSEHLSINNSGQIAGSINFGGNPQPVTWNASGTRIRLALLSGYTSGEALDINNAGQIVGFVSKPGTGNATVYRAILWQPDGKIVDLGTLTGETESQAASLNNTGKIIGWSGTPEDVWDSEHKYPVIWEMD